ncbi:MAG: hypothetical protein U1E21_01165 [Reyranellaceae bacterium]
MAHGIARRRHDDGDRRRRLLEPGQRCPAAGRDDHVDLAADQIGNRLHVVGAAQLGHEIAAIDMTQLGHSAQEGTHIAVAGERARHLGARTADADNSDARHSA